MLQPFFFGFRFDEEVLFFVVDFELLEGLAAFLGGSQGCEETQGFFGGSQGFEAAAVTSQDATGTLDQCGMAHHTWDLIEGRLGILESQEVCGVSCCTPNPL